MKNIQKYIIALISLLVLISCDKDCEESSGIRGEWEWISSTGGFGGLTITPATLGATKSLKIGASFFLEYQDDVLIFESQYELYMRPDSAWGTRTFIRYENGEERAVILDGSDLHLIELCADCFVHSYVRK